MSNTQQIFKTGQSIVYPTHGVGKIISIEVQEIAGLMLELYIIEFDKDKMTLKVPTNKVESVGMRAISDGVLIERALKVLKGRARVKRAMWSRRAQEYEQKIHSGDIIAIAEVVRDLHRNDEQREQSYSERQLYEAALERLSREVASSKNLNESEAIEEVTTILNGRAKVSPAPEKPDAPQNDDEVSEDTA